jgi:hypothetical protein
MTHIDAPFLINVLTGKINCSFFPNTVCLGINIRLIRGYSVFTNTVHLGIHTRLIRGYSVFTNTVRLGIHTRLIRGYSVFNARNLSVRCFSTANAVFKYTGWTKFSFNHNKLVIHTELSGKALSSICVNYFLYWEIKRTGCIRSIIQHFFVSFTL